MNLFNNRMQLLSLAGLSGLITTGICGFGFFLALNCVSISRSVAIWLVFAFALVSPLILSAILLIKRRIPHRAGFECFFTHYGLNIIIACVIGVSLYWYWATVNHIASIPVGEAWYASSLIDFLKAIQQSEIDFWKAVWNAYGIQIATGNSWWEAVRVTIQAGFSVWYKAKPLCLNAILGVSLISIWMFNAYFFETCRCVTLQVYNRPCRPVLNSFQRFLNATYILTVTLLFFIIINLWLGMPTGCAMQNGVMVQLFTLLVNCTPIETMLVISSFGYVSYAHYLLSGQTWENMNAMWQVIRDRLLPNIPDYLSDEVLVTWALRFGYTSGLGLAGLVQSHLWNNHYLLALIIACLSLGIVVIGTLWLGRNVAIGTPWLSESERRKEVTLWLFTITFIFSFLISLAVAGYQCFDPQVITGFISSHYCFDPGCNPIYSFGGDGLGVAVIDPISLEIRPFDNQITRELTGCCYSPNEKGNWWWPFGPSVPASAGSPLNAGVPTSALAASATQTLDLNSYCVGQYQAMINCLRNTDATSEDIARLQGRVDACNSMHAITMHNTRQAFIVANSQGESSASLSHTKVFVGEAGKAFGSVAADHLATSIETAANLKGQRK